MLAILSSQMALLQPRKEGEAQGQKSRIFGNAKKMQELQPKCLSHILFFYLWEVTTRRYLIAVWFAPALSNQKVKWVNASRWPLDQFGILCSSMLTPKVTKDHWGQGEDVFRNILAILFHVKQLTLLIPWRAVSFMSTKRNLACGPPSPTWKPRPNMNTGRMQIQLHGMWDHTVAKKLSRRTRTNPDKCVTNVSSWRNPSL